MALTMGEVRKALAATADASWSADNNLPDSAQVPQYASGGERSVPASQVPPIDLAEVVSGKATNPLLLQRRANLGLIDHPLAKVRLPTTMAVEADRTRPPAVDWRDRWGVAWLTTIQNQNPCQSCWAFAATALLETMVRIEHGVWAKRSEGDLRDGWGVAEQNWLRRDGVAPCGHGAGEGDALDYVVRKGVCDPGCYPWYRSDHAYTPTVDRDGRTTRIDGYKSLGTAEEQKQWIDAVGPITAFLTAYADFRAYSTGVYRKQLYEELFSNGVGHILLIVGYDDVQGCWIVRNSWGTGWGQAGYGLIAYGEVGIDQDAKYGLQNTNPDPWSKRRRHNGCVLESSNGPSHRNFEMLRGAVPRVQHAWRAGGENGDFSWHDAGELEDPNDPGAGGASVGYPVLISSTYGRNFEAVYWEASRRLRHWWFDQKTQRWRSGGRFGPTDVAGFPGFIQGNYGAPGNFEVVVRTEDGRLNHWWRDASFSWHDGGRFAESVRQSGPSLVQSQLGTKGNLDLVCVLETGHLQHWWRDNDGDSTWKGGTIFGNGVGDTPVAMIQSDFGARDEQTPGNFELCVAVNGHVEHWWRNNALPERLHAGGLLRKRHPDPPDWIHGASFGDNVKHVWGLLQGSFAFDLEIIVERLDGTPQHYWRDPEGWYEGDQIIV
jgi:hypothetical protein